MGVILPPPNMPGPLNTGSFTPLSQMTIHPGGNITQAGAFFEHVWFQSRVVVKAPNVRFYDCYCDAGSENLSTVTDYTLNCLSPLATNTLSVRCTWKGARSAVVIGSNIRLVRVDLSRSVGDAIKGNGNIEVCSSYIHNLGDVTVLPGAHCDGAQCRKNDHFWFLNNTVELPYPAPYPEKTNAAFIIEAADGPISDVRIQGNVLNGGNFTVYLRADPLPLTDAKVVGNWFGRDFNHGLFSNNVPFFGRENRWADTGLLILPSEANLNPNQ